MIHLSDEALAVLRQQQAEHLQGFLLRREGSAKRSHRYLGCFWLHQIGRKVVEPIVGVSLAQELLPL